MRIYLAAKWSRKEEMQRLIPVIESWGHEVVSTWTQENATGSQELWEFTPLYKGIQAERDFLEIRQADVLLLFGEEEGSENKGGGRFVEMGYALGLGKRVVFVGGYETIFHNYPMVYPVWDGANKGLQEALSWLEAITE